METRISQASCDLRLPSTFHWLNGTQFLGALNDNVFKMLVVFVLGSLSGPAAYTTILFTASVVFVLPFLLFSHAAGVLADRISKTRIIVFTKALELVIMLLGCAAIVWRQPQALYAILFLMCSQSAIFGPSKYGSIPEIVGEARLSRANSYLVGATYLAIIAGTFLPSFFTDQLWPGNYLAAGVCCVGMAIVGLATALRITPTVPAGSNKRMSPLFLRENFRTLREIRRDPELFMAVLANAYFLLLAAFMQMAVIHYGTASLNLTLEQSGYLFPIAAVGIGIGALLAGALSGRNIEFGLVPLAALGLTLSCLAVGLSRPGLELMIPLIYLAGVSAGAFIVPLSALVQFKSPPAQRGEILACANFLSFLGVALAAALFGGLTNGLGISPAGCFVVIGGLTATLTAVALYALPDFVVRFIGMCITRSLYRIRVDGAENIPIEGAALLVANHVTRMDALLLQAVTRRRIRFLMLRDVYAIAWLRPLFRLMGAIPISPRDPVRSVLAALSQARRDMDRGFLACIFAEGALTRNGHMRPFRRGFERIVKNTAYPIIPTYIGGGWGSIFSHCNGKIPGGWPRRIPYPITIIFGEPLPPSTPPQEVQRAVEALASRYYDLKRNPRRTLAHTAVRLCRQRWRHPAFADTTGKRLTFGQTLTGATALARLLEDLAPGQSHIGLLLPASVGGALANLAVTLTGRVAVNLNFTAPREALRHALDLCAIRTVLTSRAFLEKLDGIPLPAGVVYLEDLRATLTPGRKLAALWRARFARTARLMTFTRPGPDDVATIIFSSGSTGRPKGVMLSHHNILSNIEAYAQIYRFEHTASICATLPFFHAFGYTTTLWCPLVLGFSAHFHPNPLDADKVVTMIREERLTLLMTTPTFLAGYMRKGSSGDFASLRTVFTGAEKLKASMADACERSLGIRPLEGYGATELAPVVSVNIDNVSDGVWSQVGNKAGSVGHPLPGVQVKVLDPQTGAPLRADEDGLLMVRGPNVLLGYFKEPGLTHAALQDGWYNTGDIGRIDHDGFLYITDRLARFSKIGGEMVPHMAVEDRLMEALGAVENVLAITAIPDERKGEQLVLLYTPAAGDVKDLQRLVQASDMPNLWKPRRENFIAVPEIPKLGSGKMDLRRMRDAAQECMEARPGVVGHIMHRLRRAL